jgi:hypothetical protein
MQFNISKNYEKDFNEGLRAIDCRLIEEVGIYKEDCEEGHAQKHN